MIKVSDSADNAVSHYHTTEPKVPMLTITE